jgi:hypothetical protein
MKWYIHAVFKDPQGGEVLQYRNFDEAAFFTKVASARGVVEC